jgi:flagellar biosynthesis/type III secretory pathway M-ring protein FliF/YscJ
MFEGLKWKSAARRSAVVIAIYLGLLYLLSVAFPGSSFNLDSRAQIISLIVNAVIFFFIFTFVYALVERSRERRMAEARKQKKPGKQSAKEGDEEAGAFSLKGRPNPNTSRKKTRRRR